MTTTTFQGTPCLYCRSTEKRYLQEKKICASCLRGEGDETSEAAAAVRDGNGSLLCQTCKDPFPYADVDDSGKFHCYGCLRDKRIRAENNPKKLPTVTAVPVQLPPQVDADTCTAAAIKAASLVGATLFTGGTPTGGTSAGPMSHGPWSPGGWTVK